MAKKKLNCTGTNKPCGGRCIPNDWVCRDFQLADLETNEEKANLLFNTLYKASNVVKVIAVSPFASINILKKQIKTRREEKDFIGGNKDDWDKVPFGTVIKKDFKTGPAIAQHYAVYTGKDKDGNPTVFEVAYGADKNFKKLKTIGYANAENRNRTLNQWQIEDYPEGVNPLSEKLIRKNIKKIEEQIISEKKGLEYNLYAQNCEVVANAIAYGVPYTRQANFANAFERAMFSGIAELQESVRRSKAYNEETDSVLLRSLKLKLFKFDRGSKLPLGDQINIAQQEFLKTQKYYKKLGIKMDPNNRKNLLGRVYSYLFLDATSYKK